MDIVSLYYFSELARDMHMTHTASRMFISQQTLSNHIQRLEDYFGAQLLYRKPGLSLTTAGEFVLGFAEVVLKEQTNLKDILSDIAQQERGVLPMKRNLPPPRTEPLTGPGWKEHWKRRALRSLTMFTTPEPIS